MIYKIDKTGAMPGTDVFFNRVRAAFKHIFINGDILCPILSTVKQVHIAMIADSMRGGHVVIDMMRDFSMILYKKGRRSPFTNTEEETTAFYDYEPMVKSPYPARDA